MAARVEKDLVFGIHPEESKVYNSYGLPMIGNLLACAINYVRHFVSDYKFQILGSVFIANEKAVFDLDSADHVLWGNHEKLWLLLHAILGLLVHLLLV